MFKKGQIIQERYRIFDQKLGGMGLVIFCEDLHWKVGGQSTKVVLKSLLPKYLGHSEAKKRFINEALLWVELGKHPNIVQAHYVKRIKDNPFICLEFIEGAKEVGPDLQNWIESGRLELGKALAFADQFCVGMIYATSCFAKKNLRFIHRDIKPANVLISRGNQLKITDFGLAKAVGETRLVQESTDCAKAESSGNITMVGSLLGTPNYMSPEQCRGECDLDVRSDIYSFGCMLYEMATGQTVFPKGSVNHMLDCHLRSDPISPTKMRPDLPKSLEKIILRCLEKQPEHRYGNFQSIRDELSAVLKRAPGASTKQLNAKDEQSEPSDLHEQLNKSMSLYELGKRGAGVELFAKAIGKEKNQTKGNQQLDPTLKRRLVKGGVKRPDPKVRQDQAGNGFSDENDGFQNRLRPSGPEEKTIMQDNLTTIMDKPNRADNLSDLEKTVVLRKKPKSNSGEQ